MARKRWMIAAIPLLAAALVAGTSGYLTFLRAPANTPSEFLDEGPDEGTEAVVVAAGSSSTQGTASGDYVAMLRDRLGGEGYEFVNAGANGATSADLREDLEEIIACDPDAVTLFIGGNDARNALDSEGGTAAALQDYRSALTEILTRLNEETEAEIAVLSPQPSGERPTDEANQVLARHGEVLSDVAAEHGVTYLPLNEELTSLIAAETADPHPGEFSFAAAYAAGFRHYILGQGWDDIAERNGYVLHTDGLHLSDTGAAVAAELIEDWLGEALPPHRVG